MNDAAVSTYGYSREEFLQMTLRDIRPPEEIAAFDKAILHHQRGLNDAGVWRHRRKDGRVIFADIRVFGYTQDGQQRELVVARDVTKRTARGGGPASVSGLAAVAD